MNTNQSSRPTLEQIQCHMWVMLNCLPSYAATHNAHMASVSQHQVGAQNALGSLQQGLAANAGLAHTAGNIGHIPTSMNQQQQSALSQAQQMGLAPTGMTPMDVTQQLAQAQAQMQMNAITNQFAMQHGTHAANFMNVQQQQANSLNNIINNQPSLVNNTKTQDGGSSQENTSTTDGTSSDSQKKMDS